MTRIVLECGNLGADRAIIDRPDFAERVAEGVVAGIAEALPDVATPVFPPFGTSGELAHARSVRITASTLRIRKFAETGQEVIATLVAGSEFPVSGWIIGENVEGNPVWWITGRGERNASRWRMWSGGTDLSGAEVLALPTIA
jgi:poly(3-hydroxyalkanoate) synthetase